MVIVGTGRRFSLYSLPVVVMVVNAQRNISVKTKMRKKDLPFFLSYIPIVLSNTRDSLLATVVVGAAVVLAH